MKSSWTQLACLALGAFAIGTESYVIAGLLPDLATDLGVSVSFAGQLITVFSLVYAIGSPVMAVITGRWERRRLLLTSLVSFALFNVAAALTHSYAMLLLARVGLALSAATFMPAASAYAVAVSAVAQRGRALAVIYSGLTVATVVGVPIGVMIGERFGWRTTFVVVAGLASIALIGLGLTLARTRAGATVPLSERIAIARRPDVLQALGVTVVTLTGAFTVYAYLAPFLQQTAHVSGTMLAIVLFLFGAGAAVGNLVSGLASDRIGPDRVIKAVLVTLIGLFVSLSLAGMFLPPETARWVILPTLTFWGFVGWSFPAAQQARLVAMAPALAPITLSLNASAIYLGVSLGAFIGSLVVAGHSVVGLGWIAAGCEALALILFLRWRGSRAGVQPRTRVETTALAASR